MEKLPARRKLLIEANIRIIKVAGTVIVSRVSSNIRAFRVINYGPKQKKKPLELFGLDTESYANYKPFIHFRVIAITEIRTVDKTFTEYQLI